MGRFESPADEVEELRTVNGNIEVTVPTAPYTRAHNGNVRLELRTPLASGQSQKPQTALSTGAACGFAGGPEARA
jgi:DUF4097 and DUF4098 domain-containing protein YvlB